MILTPTQPPQSLRHVVATHVAWATDGDWHPLFGGRTNSAWRLTRRGTADAVILKLYRAPAGNPLFPNDPKAEAILLRHLSGTGLAPELIASADHGLGHFNLYQAIPGAQWRDGTKDVAGLIKRLHAIPPPEGLRQAANGSDALLAQADAILAQCRNVASLSALRPQHSVLPTKDHVLLHTDIVAGNLIRNPSGLHLIDWQCPAIGDATEDLATFLSPGMQMLYRGTPLAAAEVSEFLGQFSEGQNIRYRMLCPFYHFRLAAYCLWQSERDAPDYEDGYCAEIVALAQALEDI
ncbi:phosphotransferase [Cognatishimia sp. SS12]|uniref:phosphotransferase n=1 Tax=Cognatishimia sp. SS12 TaxID=2979465 RepID=UPI00232CE7BF|nr:phosphotransferase [Cognatishimia sp. SS12]MDC0737617.1 phosphotransferase [Cognatishimia sp. SS12]